MALSSAGTDRNADLRDTRRSQTVAVTYQTPHPPGPSWPGRPPRRPGLWNRLSPLQRAGLIAAILVLPCCGGLTALGALTGDRSTETVTTSEQLTDRRPAAAPAEQEPAGSDLATGEPTTDPTTAAPRTAATTAPAPPAVTKRLVTARESVPFPTRRVRDADLAKGETRVRQRGANGVRTRTYEVTVTDGVPGARRLIRTVVTRKPVARVVAVGTKEESNGCHPNYRPCVPISSDVDCAGGSGNGPEYVDGPIEVIGDDPYGLDRDNDGIACDT